MKRNLLYLVCAFLLLSCSSEEVDYNPAWAIRSDNTVFLSIEKKNGEEYDCEDLLSKKDISIYGNESKKEIPLSLANYNGSRMLDFKADLPNSSSMTYNSERTEGNGHSDVTISLKDKNVKIRFYYKYAAAKAGFLGSSVIYIDSIECKNQKIKPKEDSQNHIFTLKEDINGELIVKQ